MKLPLAGQKVKAFVVSDNEFGDVTLRLLPSAIEKYIGTRSFTMMHRYFYTVEVYVCYRDSVSSDATSSLYGDEQVKGDVIIFGYDGSIKSLSDFEVSVLRSCAVMMKLEGKNRLLLSNMTTKPHDLPFIEVMDCVD